MDFYRTDKDYTPYFIVHKIRDSAQEIVGGATMSIRDTIRNYMSPSLSIHPYYFGITGIRYHLTDYILSITQT